MQKTIENISLGMAALFVLSIVGLIGFGVAYVFVSNMMYVNLWAVLGFFIIGSVGILTLITFGLVLHTIGKVVNRRLSRRI